MPMHSTLTPVGVANAAEAGDPTAPHCGRALAAMGDVDWGLFLHDWEVSDRAHRAGEATGPLPETWREDRRSAADRAGGRALGRAGGGEGDGEAETADLGGVDQAGVAGRGAVAAVATRTGHARAIAYVGVRAAARYVDLPRPGCA